MTITDADRALAARIFHPGYGMDCAVIAQQVAAHRLAGVLAGREGMQNEAAEVPENCCSQCSDAIRAIPLVKP